MAHNQSSEDWPLTPRPLTRRLPRKSNFYQFNSLTRAPGRASIRHELVRVHARGAHTGVQQLLADAVHEPRRAGHVTNQRT